MSGPSPLKPWERKGGPSGRTSTPTSSLSTMNTSMNTSMDTPRPPSRPWESNTSSMTSYGGNSPYQRMGGYGSMGGGYGNSYGGYGNSYGGYGSSYGSYGGMSGYGGGMYGRGMYGNMGMNGGMIPPPKGLAWMSSLQAITEIFGRFSRMVEISSSALFGSMSSIYHLLESLGVMRLETSNLFSGFAIFRLFSALYTRVASMLGFGSSSMLSEYESSNWTPGNRWVKYMVLAGLSYLFVNYLKTRLPVSPPPTPEHVIATHDFEASSPQELSFSRGDSLNIVEKPFPEWWMAEKNGQRGLVPITYLDHSE